MFGRAAAVRLSAGDQAVTGLYRQNHPFWGVALCLRLVCRGSGRRCHSTASAARSFVRIPADTIYTDMLGTGWQALRTPDPRGEYLSVVTHLPLQKWRVLPKFLSHTVDLRRELAACSGLVGYRLQLRVKPLEFWTASVWVDEASLWAFVHGGAHRAAAGALLDNTGHTRVAHWMISGSSIPETWRQMRLKMASKL